MPTLYQYLLLSFAFLFSATPVTALELSLEDWIFNIDGSVSEAFNGDALPAQGNLVAGLGTYSLSVAGAGNHNVIGFFDFEMYEDTNTFFNESASIFGAAAAGQSWEVDEPGFVFGDIVDNVIAGSLQNHNAVSAGLEDDVSFAMGWDFSLLDTQTATIDFVFTDILPTVGFYITQLDPDLGESFYFYSTLTIEGTGVAVPEPSVLSLLMIVGMLLAGKSSVRRFVNDKS